MRDHSTLVSAQKQFHHESVSLDTRTGSVNISGSRVDLMSWNSALEQIMDAAVTDQKPALAVASANLDHLYHFGPGGAAYGRAMVDNDRVRWLNLIDGAPIAACVRRLTGQDWPRLAGSDLLLPILWNAAQFNLRVGFLGGTEDSLARLRTRVADKIPTLNLAGTWSPSRQQITSPLQSTRLAKEIRTHDVQILVVGLGKPRQEMWIQRNGAATGARVLLAFGASADFLAGTANRAPVWVQSAGLEWSYRLAKEPRRLWRRYLLQGPPAYAQLRRARPDEIGVAGGR